MKKIKKIKNGSKNILLFFMCMFAVLNATYAQIDFDTSDCDTILVNTEEDIEALQDLDWEDCHIIIFGDSSDLAGLDTLDFDPFDFDPDFGDYGDFGGFGDSIDCPLDSIDFDEFFANCDTVLVETVEDFIALSSDSSLIDSCVIFTYGDDFDWDALLDSLAIDFDYDDYGYGNYDPIDFDDLFTDCDTVLIETVEDFLDISYDADTCIIYTYADDFDWDALYDSLAIDFDSYGYGGYGYTGDFDGDCGFDGYIDFDVDYDYTTFDVSDAVVTVLDENGYVVAIVNANADGTFDFDGLAAGTYTIVVSLDGFEFELGEITFDGTGEYINDLAIEERTDDAADVTGIEETIEIENLITLYPNPTVDVINVKMEDVRDARILVQNQEGKVMAVEANVNSTTTVIDVKAFAKGFYTVTVINDNKSNVRSFIKE